MSEEKKYSPYSRFKYWLLSNTEEELSEDIIKAITPKYVFSMLCGNKELVDNIKEFNTLNIYYSDPSKFYKYVKSVVKKLKLSSKDFTYHKEPKKINDDVLNKFPRIKNYEIELLLNNINDDETKESFGLLKENKIKKLKKSEVIKIEEKIKTKKEIATFKDLKELLTENRKGKMKND